MHVDQHGLAVPSDYDPPHGHCRVYVANDGGVYRARNRGSACLVSTTTFVQAMHGLHAFGSFGLGVISRPSCPHGVPAPCPGLYLPSNDNGTWGSRTGGHGGPSAWSDMGCCGDNGVVLTDWRLAHRVVVPRGNNYQLHIARDGAPPINDGDAVRQLACSRPTAGAPCTEPVTEGLATGTATNALVLQTQTPIGQTVPAKGDYFAVRSVARFGADTSQNDAVVRNLTSVPSGWTRVGPELPPRAIGEVQVGDGGRAIYVLEADDRPELGTDQGTVLRLVTRPIGPELVRTEWQSRSAGLNRANNLIADPFDGDVLYATDLGDPTTLADDRIRTSRDGGVSWSADAALTRLALAEGTVPDGLRHQQPDLATAGHGQQREHRLPLPMHAGRDGLRPTQPQAALRRARPGGHRVLPRLRAKLAQAERDQPDRPPGSRVLRSRAQPGDRTGQPLRGAALPRPDPRRRTVVATVRQK